jgi:hypothetical protein
LAGTGIDYFNILLVTHGNTITIPKEIEGNKVLAITERLNRNIRPGNVGCISLLA